MASKNFKIDGVIAKIFDKESKSATFTVREFVIEVADGNYPQLIKMQMTQDYCDLLDGYAEGQSVEVSFSLRGREYQGKYFTTLNAFKIAGNVQAEPVPTQAEPAAYVTDDTPDNTPSDDLPF